MTDTQIGLTVCDRITTIQGTFIDTVCDVARCAKRSVNGQSVTDALNDFETEPGEVGEVARLVKGIIELGSNSVDDKTLLFLLATQQLQELQAQINVEEIERDIRNSLLSFQREGQEVHYLHDLDGFRRVMQSGDDNLNRRIETVREWVNDEGPGWLYCIVAEQLKMKLDQVARCINRFLTNSLHACKFIETTLPTSTDQDPGRMETGPTQTITWNTDASVLYDIFGQLLTMKLPSGVMPIHWQKGDHTIKHIAAMIHRHFSFVTAIPTLDQIERQLQAGASNNTVAKRNKITIDCRPERGSE